MPIIRSKPLLQRIELLFSKYSERGIFFSTFHFNKAQICMAEPGLNHFTQSARGAREQSQIMSLPLVQKMHLYCRVIEINSIRLLRAFLAQLSSFAWVLRTKRTSEMSASQERRQQSECVI